MDDLLLRAWADETRRADFLREAELRRLLRGHHIESERRPSPRGLRCRVGLGLMRVGERLAGTPLQQPVSYEQCVARG